MPITDLFGIKNKKMATFYKVAIFIKKRSLPAW